jgi:uncharacterized protein YdhG (YjbR/CyaY superfamily)
MDRLTLPQAWLVFQKGSIMENNKTTYETIDEYIAAFPAEKQKKLQELRDAIKAAAPEAAEKISYQMPAFFLNGILVYFAAHKNHIGFYPTGSGIQAFQQELSVYEYSKGTVKFPLDQPLPVDLIGRIVKFRVAEILRKSKKTKSKN